MRLQDMGSLAVWEVAGPSVRRFLINTLFDSTFMLLGIVVGSAFTAKINPLVVVTTMTTSSLALGISTGVSVYEAENLEQERGIAKMERGMLKDLGDTFIEKRAKTITTLTSIINFFTPLFACSVMVLPFVFVNTGILKMEWASWAAILLALMMLFMTGAYMGKIGNKNPWLKGLRMTGFGIIAFIIGRLIYSLL